MNLKSYPYEWNFYIVTSLESICVCQTWNGCFTHALLYNHTHSLRNSWFTELCRFAKHHFIIQYQKFTFFNISTDLTRKVFVFESCYIYSVTHKFAALIYHTCSVNSDTCHYVALKNLMTIVYHTPTALFHAKAPVH